jgi:hypothetical protein
MLGSERMKEMGIFVDKYNIQLHDASAGDKSISMLAQKSQVSLILNRLN